MKLNTFDLQSTHTINLETGEVIDNKNGKQKDA